ncbi:dolichyl-diphosphooligosaccharide-protein glycotransferase [Rhodotorula toruloides]|uniref:Dolichyl-diphosphooligosaccharide-protein glycotransferase n=1 Tax=Rhodotorula toruloides TaxID=5286 RepID=A0A511KAD4_RHOTO|nr:dolichyl-diphosphooligosaccharide-protein glycotransferase [Rhodotorula toruloides]
MARWLASAALLAVTASSLARAAIVVRDGKLSLIDAVGASAVATTAFTSDSPAPLPARQLSPTDALKLSFTVLNDSAPFAPQQAAVLVQPVNEEERRVPGRDWTSWVKVRQNSGKARWDLDLSRADPSLLSLSAGPLSFTLILGHQHVGPLSLPLGTFTLPSSLVLPFPFPPDEDLPKHWEVERYKTMPEIQWTFREGEKKVNPVVALGGTAFVLAPWLVLLAALRYILPSMHLSSSPLILTFLASLTALELLFIVYWVQLRLIPTLPIFLGLGTWNAWIGRLALGEVRKKRIAREEKEAGKKVE